MNKYANISISILFCDFSFALVKMYPIRHKTSYRHLNTYNPENNRQFFCLRAANSPLGRLLQLLSRNFDINQSWSFHPETRRVLFNFSLPAGSITLAQRNSPTLFVHIHMFIKHNNPVGINRIRLIFFFTTKEVKNIKF